jgi:3D (Asp-Asp-Asp) domain-containing protein
MRYFRRKIRKIARFLLKINKIYLLFIVLPLIFPHYSLASGITDNYIDNYSQGVFQFSYLNPSLKLPENDQRNPRYTTRLIATAYNSLPFQTDDDPCTTASGLNVCKRNTEDIIAANFLPLGTLVKIPDLYGDRIFRVEDRMNKKYYKQIDIWMKDYDEAVHFGSQLVKIEVY